LGKETLAPLRKPHDNRSLRLRRSWPKLAVSAASASIEMIPSSGASASAPPRVFPDIDFSRSFFSWMFRIAQTNAFGRAVA
jgi:hypothetical protein